MRKRSKPRQEVSSGAERGAAIANESALTVADAAGLVGRFSIVNIKFDKCGGLTEGLATAREACRLGLGLA
jgi:L-alanine-DL-glutamate epimerase-like enolase superfamily enzyme